MSNVSGLRINILADQTDEVLDAMVKQVAAGLEACGLVAESYAKSNIRNRPISSTSWYTRTGNLRNKITHRVRDTDEKAVYIGTDVDYAIYVEMGTGPYVEDGSGRKDVPWFFKDEEGNGHLSYGIPASHFLKKAIEEHENEYVEILKDALKP